MEQKNKDEKSFNPLITETIWNNCDKSSS